MADWNSIPESETECGMRTTNAAGEGGLRVSSLPATTHAMFAPPPEHR